MPTLMTPDTRPRLQPTVIAVPLDSHRLAIHRGTRQSDESLVYEDAQGWKQAALAMCTGGQTVAEISAQLEVQGHTVSADALERFFESLLALKAIAPHDWFDSTGLTDAQRERYSRNLNGFAALASDGEMPAGLQRRLMDGHVLMLGAGGLGSLTSTALAMAGCGTLSVIDFDEVELSNLNRQAYTMADIGRRKVDALKARVAAANPEVAVNAVAQRLRGVSDVRSAIADFDPDIVVAAIDRPTIAADRWISDACFQADVAAMFNSVSAGKGLLWSKVPGKTGCFQCDERWSLEKTPDHHAMRRYREAHDSIPATSAFSYAAMTVAGLMASDIVRHLVGWPMASAGKLVVVDFATLAIDIREKPAHPDCPICAN